MEVKELSKNFLIKKHIVEKKTIKEIAQDGVTLCRECHKKTSSYLNGGKGAKL
jgi:hypothetical protein